MQIETKANVGNKVFYLSKIKRVLCPVCNGTGKIALGDPIKPNMDSLETFMNSVHEEFEKNVVNAVLGNTKQYKCPECNGRGTLKATGQVKYEVHQGVICGISTKVSESKTITTYTISKEDGNTIPLDQHDIWLNNEDAIQRCNFLNLERRLYPIECIQIPESFSKTIPHNDKLMKRLDEWRKSKKLETEIYIDSSGKLFDGYTSYLIYRMLGIVDVPVVIWPKKEIPNPAFEGMF